MFEPEVFIDLVKARPPLYNSSLLEYKSKQICKALWKEVADTVNRDVNQCRTVWTSLRSSYARHLQNMENNTKGINLRKKVPWYLAEKMSFLNDFMLRPPQERNITINHDELNNTTTSTDDNSITFSNFEYKSDNNCTMDDNISIVTIKSEDLSELTLSTDEITSSELLTETRAETEDPCTNYGLQMCRVEVNSNDVKRKRNQIEKVPPKAPVSKRCKTSSDAPSLATREEESDNVKAREESTLMFFQSILFDIRKLSDRKLRFFKQDILQDLNKYLDEDENED